MIADAVTASLWTDALWLFAAYGAVNFVGTLYLLWRMWRNE
jgi:hypothetical protein